jgi:hypothetical protein
MSLFRVHLNTVTDGLMDTNPKTHLQNKPSYQRTIYIMGPNRINRELHDGDEFVDCNYWQKFDYGQPGGFIETVTNDGSVWNDYTKTSSNIPYSKTFTVASNATTYLAANTANILSDTGSVSVYTRIINDADALTGSVIIGLNGTVGSPVATFTLAGGTSMIFEVGDLSLSLIQVKNIASGGVSSTIEIFSIVQSVINGPTTPYGTGTNTVPYTS